MPNNDFGEINTPVFDMLNSTRGRTWLHMPGHGGELAWLSAQLDLTELSVTDDLHEPEEGGAFERAQALYAQDAGAACTFFLAGGSTLGVQAMLLAFVPPGGCVILPRDAHKSAVSACAIGGLSPIYVSPVWDDGAGRAFIHADDVVNTLREHPEADAVFITRPDYYGVCQDIVPIVRQARAQGAAVLVDEAHGAHFPFGGDAVSAGELGADAWTQSAHKTLPALTQSALLHFREKKRSAAARRAINMLSSSSPSFLLAASLDWARALMRETGALLIRRVAERNVQLREELSRLGYGDSYSLWRGGGRVFDSARLVVDTIQRGVSGFQAQTWLAERAVDVEMADERRIVCIPPLMKNEEALSALAVQLAQMPCGKTIGVRPCLPPAIPERAMTVREAAFAPCERVDIARACGRVAADSFGAYPPGIPLAMPGERISAQTVKVALDALKGGARFFGAGGGQVSVVAKR